MVKKFALVHLLQFQHQGQCEGSSSALLPPGWEEFRRAVSVATVSERRMCDLYGLWISVLLDNLRYILYYINMVLGILNSLYNSQLSLSKMSDSDVGI